MTEQVLLGVFHLIGGYKELTSLGCLFFLSQIKRE